MELVKKLPFSEQLEDILRRCDEYLPKSTGRRIILAGVAAGTVLYLVTRKRYKLPPGPRGWPLLGNVLEFKGTTIYNKLIEWRAKYGPVILIHAGPVAMVTLNTADSVHDAFVEKGADFAGRPQSYSLGIMSDGFRNISLVDYTPTWKLHRKLAAQALRKFLGGTRVEQAVASSLEVGIEEMKKEKNPFNPRDSITLVVFNIINKMCFDFTCKSDSVYMKQIVETLDPEYLDIGNGFLEDFFPPLRLFPSKKLKVLIKLMDDWMGWMNENLVAHRATFDKNNIRDVCDAILLSQIEAQEEEDATLLAQITDRHIIQTLIDVFGAGIDSSRNTLLWCLKYIAGHPEVQAKIHDEVDKVLGSRRFPKFSERKDLAYTEATLHEVMRIASFGTLSLPHMTTCDTKLGEYDIPKGTMVLANMYAVHHDPAVWDEPEVFRPERFLDKDGKLAPKHKGWIPFSSGRRMCLGESVARPELHLLLAGILKEFKVSPPSGETFTYESTGQSFLFFCKDYKLVMESRS